VEGPEIRPTDTGVKVSDYKYQLPEDIDPSWLPVIRRLQSVAKSQGLAVISINILVDEFGKPKAWTSPEKTKIEPKGASSALIQLFISGAE